MITNSHLRRSRISTFAKSIAAIAIEDASCADTVLSVKQRVFAANRSLYLRRLRPIYIAPPRGENDLEDDDETLGGAGVAQDGSAELDVLLGYLTAAEAKELGEKVRLCSGRMQESTSFFAAFCFHCTCHYLIRNTRMLRCVCVFFVVLI